MKFSRRSFVGSMLAAAGAAASAKAAPARSTEPPADLADSVATLIDLTRCDGCPDRDTPACVSACRTENSQRFPEPDPEMLKPYWPQPMYEDWSDKRHLTNRLTPYNWTFVQQVEVEHEGEVHQMSVPRRCMHCDNPPCAKICPFSVNKKHADGAVTIDPDLCFGGAKCRTVCPWDIPQRQAGVGIYTYIDPIPAGGGVMFKCDLCKPRLDAGQTPACTRACPQNAMKIGARQEIYQEAYERVEREGGYIYGDTQNGGTATLYYSRVPFEKINLALLEQSPEPRKVLKLHNPKNMLEEHKGSATAVLAAPVIGAVGALAATLNKDKSRKEDENA